MVDLITGHLGMGKSLLAVIIAKTACDSGTRVICNFSTTFAEQYEYKTFLRGGYHDCMIIIDEVYQYVDSRSSMSDINQFFSYILFQSRKLRIELIIIAQEINTVDIRYRLLLDNIITCYKTTKGFYFIREKADKSKTGTVFLPFEKAEPFFSMYNTNEVIFEHDLQYKDPDQLLEESKDIAVMLVNSHQNQKISKSLVNIHVLEHKLDKKQASMIYDYCRTLQSASKSVKTRRTKNI